MNVIIISTVIGLFLLISLGIKLIVLIGSGLWYLCLNIGMYIDDIRAEKNRKRYYANIDQNREIAIIIIEKFEELLSIKNIKIPNEERENEENEACIYGSDYYDLENTITEILECRKEVNT